MLGFFSKIVCASAFAFLAGVPNPVSASTQSLSRALSKEGSSNSDNCFFSAVI